MNPERRIKQLLDEATIETGDGFDRHLLDNAWQGSHQCRRINTIIVTVAASLVIWLGRWWILDEAQSKQPLHSPPYAQTSLCELRSLGTLNKACQLDLLSGLNQLMDQANHRSGPRPDRLTVEEILNECDEL